MVIGMEEIIRQIVLDKKEQEEWGRKRYEWRGGWCVIEGKVLLVVVCWVSEMH